MLRSRLTPVIAAFTLVCVAALPARAQDTAKVATANTGQIFNQIRETKDLQAKVDGLRKDLAQQEQAKRAAVTALQESRNQFKPESDQYRDKNGELMRAAIEFETWGRVNQADLTREQKQQMKYLFDKIEQAVGEVAKQKGLDIVVADQRGEIANLDQLNPDQLRVLLNQRIVLFSSPKAEITNDVIAYMDKNYKSPAPAPSAGGAAAPAPGK
jgi:Skp family chaperone for outer membrane proteins